MNQDQAVVRMAGAYGPVVVPGQVWDREEARKALRGRDVSTVLKLVQQHTGVSQHRLAVALGISQPRLNELLHGRRVMLSLTSFERLADGLMMPDRARVLLGLAPCTVSVRPKSESNVVQIPVPQPISLQSAKLRGLMSWLEVA